MIYPPDETNMKPGRHAVVSVAFGRWDKRMGRREFLYAGVVVIMDGEPEAYRYLDGHTIRYFSPSDIVAIFNCKREAKHFVDWANAQSKLAWDRSENALNRFSSELDRKIGIKRKKAHWVP